MNGHANSIDHFDDHSLHESELLQAFEAQKVVNRQLESELTALTEENNTKMLEMSEEIDELRSERNQFQEIMHNQIRSNELSEEYHSINNQDKYAVAQKQQNVDYLMAEIKSISAQYAQVLVRIGLDLLLKILFFFYVEWELLIKFFIENCRNSIQFSQ